MLTIITEDLQIITQSVHKASPARAEQLHMGGLTQDIEETRRRNVIVRQGALRLQLVNVGKVLS
jgi:hypothetical protein